MTGPQLLKLAQQFMQTLVYLCSMTSTFNDEYWSGRYQAHNTLWNIGHASPPLTAYIDQLEDVHKKILIPGCGFAYEADYLLEKGFTDITLLDISSALTGVLQKKFRDKPVRIIHEDFFAHRETYDLVLEQTFFCSLPPDKRKDYVSQLFDLLRPGATLAGVFFNRTFEDSPPYGSSRNEYQELFELKLFIKSMEPCYNSIPARQGSELFVILKNIV